MPKRTADWLKQAERDLSHAESDLREGYYEWACFSAQQAAEKALEAVYQGTHQLAWGHSVLELLKALSDLIEVPHLLIEGGKLLDKFYLLTRYPNGFASGAPTDYFTAEEAKEAIDCASQIIRFCKDHLP